MFCMDVKQLYPSVPRLEAKQAITSALKERYDTKTNIETSFEMMETVLDNNYFYFNNKTYVQTSGTAIGSKLGKNYACTYLGVWEDKLLGTAQDKPLVFYRYIDDI